MRYLNKIILINSASVKYAEINVEGNVHFIGTQGVGKSTLLRALLFFYNANQQKLGIPVGKKSFAEFYFPFQDSYIIYEVSRETGSYCILAFKSQGRVCFRFLNSAYDKKYFIGDEGSAFDSWERQKNEFGKEQISYTKKIDRYEDYRNILYGNSQSIGPEFRKYSILESKQYQNIPRAIQHVFLNYKVESEFIKDTIIKSLNEEEICIELSSYAHHLKDFETQLNDIKKWTEKTRNGEILVRKQAETITTTYLSIRHLERQRMKLAGELSWQLHKITEEQPVLEEKLESQENRIRQLHQKIADTDKRFQNKKDKITGEINILESKIKEAKIKLEEYESLNIDQIIEKVSKRNQFESEHSNLRLQKELIEGQFADINQKYEARFNQLKNHFTAFENIKIASENKINSDFIGFKDNLHKEYELLLHDINNQHQEKLELAYNELEEKKAFIQNLRIKESELKHRRFFEKELDQYQIDIHSFRDKSNSAQSENKQLAGEIETLKKQWELDKERAEEITAQKKAAFSRDTKTLEKKISSIENKLENSNDSFYGWLNREYPGWENTIGKVIDEETILFQKDLFPQKLSENEFSFYGVKLDLEEIDKGGKTVADYENEKTQHLEKMAGIQKVLSKLSAQSIVESDNFKRKYQPVINKHKDTIRTNEYHIELDRKKSDEAKVNLEDYRKKAVAEKNAALEKVHEDIQKNSEERILSENTVREIQKNIQKQLEQKRRERDRKVEMEQSRVNELFGSIRVEIIQKDSEIKQEIAALKREQLEELGLKGADTSKIAEIDKRISHLEAELNFIENNRDIVAEYNKDKRELFDKTPIFRTQKTQFASQLETEQERFNVSRQKQMDEMEVLRQESQRIQVHLKNIAEDLQKYQGFELTEGFQSLGGLPDKPNDDFKTEKRCSILVDEYNQTYFTGIRRYNDLQEAVNKFTSHFFPNNIFSFKTNLVEQSEFYQFAEELKEFIDEDKIATFEKRVNELFADIIKLVGKETTGLLSREGEIEKVISGINRDFVKRNFAGVIKSIQLRLVVSSNKIVQLLTEIKKFNDDNIHDLGEANLFSSDEQSREAKNKKAIGLLTILVKEISNYKHEVIHLADSFELEFRIIENDNDTNWVQNLANVGSDGTDVLVKAMINIMLLNVFKENATKNKFKDFKLHCMMDEVGKLHPNNVRGILKFANDRNINLINSSPQSFDALAYRYTYKLAKDAKNVTVVNRLITNNRERP